MIASHEGCFQHALTGISITLHLRYHTFIISPPCTPVKSKKDESLENSLFAISRPLLDSNSGLQRAQRMVYQCTISPDVVGQTLNKMDTHRSAYDVNKSTADQLAMQI